MLDALAHQDETIAFMFNGERNSRVDSRAAYSTAMNLFIDLVISKQNNLLDRRIMFNRETASVINV